MIKIFLLLAGISTVISSFIFFHSGDRLHEIKNGKEDYILFCQSCHMENGEGVEKLYPPLAKTNYLKNTQKIIDVILYGQSGEVKVNDKKYNTDMPAQAYLTDEQIAGILTYIRSNWGNKYPPVTTSQVKAQRK
jgi:mono/diheme cytochrome c family protein